MLTGNLVRLKFHRDRVSPAYLDPFDADWLAAAEELIDLYRAALGGTRGEVAAEVAELVGESDATLVQQGLAKLLDDRCDYETVAGMPPDEVREAAFRHAATLRATGQFDRTIAMERVAKELGVSAEEVETLLFADLKDEQRILKFEDITPERLLHRYNVALVQAILLRSVGLDVQVRGETPARYRQLFRAIRFRRLIAVIRETPDGFALRIDGPLSLFSATQKYGLQLALFLPTLLLCKDFNLTAQLLWGTAKREKRFELSSEQGLVSHTQDFGTFRPREFDLFAASFRDTISGWQISDDPAPINLPDGVWVPDFTITHDRGQIIHLELFGYWRRVDLEKHRARLQKHIPGQFLIVVSEQLRADDDETLPEGVVHYKRTPSAEAVATAAAKLIK